MEKRNPREWLCLKRTVRFGETDAAGVVHFLELLRWCHETWEASLEKHGVVLQEIFPTNQINTGQLDVALPVVHCEANYFQPLYVGDIINIELNPEKINDSSFVLRFKFKKNGEKIGTANIKHVSINPITRDICALSKQINFWLHESSLNF
ncbi:acyl-CoA thioesterase [Prochlorococcus marinus]|uniref:acyl-CoA thioesterase n=1 Tax=Prochlorococcus marinus TaxID=1219 RepID=UPI0022B5CD42|nr:acyl-CoA thioesterase [Prochlorococcus marinus]